MRTERIGNAHDPIFGSVDHKILAEVLQWLDGSDRELVTPTDLEPTGGFGHIRHFRTIYQFAQCHSQLPPGWKRRYGARLETRESNSCGGLRITPVGDLASTLALKYR